MYSYQICFAYNNQKIRMTIQAYSLEEAIKLARDELLGMDIVKSSRD